MEMKKMFLALATVFAMTACAGPMSSSSNSSSEDSSSKPSETTTQTQDGSSEVEEVEEFLKAIYGSDAKYGSKVSVNNQTYPNVKEYYEAKKADNVVGYVFVCEGKNDYGKIKMSIGINKDGSIGKVFLIENGQSFADKVNGYVDGYNKGTNGFDDVNCGATFGATLINTMGKQAQSFVKAEINHEITDFGVYCKNIFGKDVNYIRKNYVVDSTNKTLKESWTASEAKTNKTLGRVYHATVEGMEIMVGINIPAAPGADHQPKPHTFAKAFWVNPTTGADADAANAFITKLNAGEANLEENSADNKLIKNIKKVGNEALAHAAKNRITQPTDVTDLLEGTFGKVSYCEQTIVDDIANPNIIEYWNVKDANRNYIGRAYHMQMPGEHGSLDAVVGVKPNNISGGEFFKVSTKAEVPLIQNEHVDSSAAVKALKDYIKGLNDGTIKIESEEDAKNGATGTSMGIRNLCLTAVSHYGDNIIADIYLDKTFGTDASYVDRHVVGGETVREYWNVVKNNTYVGRVYHCGLKGQHATIHTMVGVNAKGAFLHMYLINKAPGEYGNKVQAYVDDLNNGTITLEDDIHNGATASSNGVRTLAKDALAHFKGEPLLPTLKNLDAVKALYADQTYTFNDHRIVSEAGFENVVEYWTVKDSTNKIIGAAYHCALPGKHATMEVTASFTQKPSDDGRSLVVELGKVNLMNKAPNEYGEILQSYVDGLNDKSISLEDDIQNGATSSSTGLRDIVKQAMKHCGINKLDEGVRGGVTGSLTKVFGEEANYGEAIALNDLANDNLLEYWDVKNSQGTYIGRVYHGAFPGTHGVLHALIGVNLDGTLKTIYWANCPVGTPAPQHVQKYGQLALDWINKINSGEIYLTDDVHSGATATTGGIVSLAEQALNHYALNIIE